MPAVEQMLAQVAAEDPLAQDALLLEAPARRPREDEAPEQGYQLPVLAEDWFDRRHCHRPAKRYGHLEKESSRNDSAEQCSDVLEYLTNFRKSGLLSCVT